MLTGLHVGCSTLLLLMISGGWRDSTAAVLLSSADPATVKVRNTTHSLTQIKFVLLLLLTQQSPAFL